MRFADSVAVAVLGVAWAFPVLAGSSSAKAPKPADSEIDRLVADGRSAQAIPLALSFARAHPDSPPAWERVRTLAGWNSDAASELLALEHLARLSPDERTLRLALAQRLLWVKRTSDALPHARWLLESPTENDPLALEVATWVLLDAKLTTEGRVALQRWIRAAPDSAQPRWILADLTHWSAEWRVAQTQYSRLDRDAEFGARAWERRRMLARDHPSSVEGRALYWSDTTGVEYFAGGVRSKRQLPARLVATSDIEVGEWRHDIATTPALGFVRGQVGLRHETSDVGQPELILGGETDTHNNLAPIIAARGHLSVGGIWFGSLEAGWDRYRQSLVAAAEDIRVHYVRLKSYVEPRPWLFIGADGSQNHLDDANRRTHGVLALGVHNTAALQIEPRVFAQFDKWSRQLPNSTPYYTVRDPLSAGGDLTVRLTQKDWWLRAEATAGAVHQAGNWAFAPRGSLAVDLIDHLIVKINTGYVGAVEYRQFRIDGSAGYRF